MLLALGMAACGVEDVLPAEVPEADIRADVQEYLAAFVDSEAQIVSLAYTQEGTGAERQVTCEVEHTNGSITLSMRYEQEKIAWVLCGTEIIRGDETAKTPEEPGDTQKNQPGTESIVAEGKCTDTISWTLGEDKVMTLSGTGSLGFWSAKNEEALPFTPEVVVVGEGITEVPTLSFQNVDSLKEYRVAEGNPVYKAVDGILYERETNILHLCPTGYDKVVDIPTGVVEIGEYAFSWPSSDRKLEGIKIPASMQMLPASVLSHFDLETVEIEAGGTYRLEAGCLYAKTTYATREGFELVRCYTNHSGSLTVPDGVTGIGDDAFNLCDRLHEIILPDTLFVIGDRAFANCSYLGEISIPEGVYSIGKSAFQECRNLRDITVDANNSFYFAENGILYEKCIDYGNGVYEAVFCFDKKELVEVLDGTVCIKGDAFSNMNFETKSIILPASLEEIEENGVANQCGKYKKFYDRFVRAC